MAERAGRILRRHSVRLSHGISKCALLVGPAGSAHFEMPCESRTEWRRSMRPALSAITHRNDCGLEVERREDRQTFDYNEPPEGEDSVGRGQGRALSSTAGEQAKRARRHQDRRDEVASARK